MTENSQSSRKTSIKIISKGGADSNTITEVMQTISGDYGPRNCFNGAQIMAVAMMMSMGFTGMQRTPSGMSMTMAVSVAVVMMMPMSMSVVSMTLLNCLVCLLKMQSYIQEM